MASERPFPPSARRLALARAAGLTPASPVVVGAAACIGAVAARQALSLAAKLPEYRENIQKKIRALRAPRDGTLGKAAEAIKQLENEAAPAAAPLPVTETPPSAFAALAELVGPFVKPIGTGLAVVVFTILLLLNRENMRERLIALIGAIPYIALQLKAVSSSVKVVVDFYDYGFDDSQTFLDLPLIVSLGPVFTPPGVGCGAIANFNLPLPMDPFFCGLVLSSQCAALCASSSGATGVSLSNCLSWELQSN